jgi:hypothetical protein
MIKCAELWDVISTCVKVSNNTSPLITTIYEELLPNSENNAILNVAHEGWQELADS